MLATRALRAASSVSTLGSAASGGAAKLLRAKTTTEMTGIPVHPSPLSALDASYTRTLDFVNKMPAESVYRQATLAIVTERLEKLQAIQQRSKEQLAQHDAEAHEAVVREVEAAIDAGQIEEVIMQADDELKLAAKMLEWRSHEPLETPAPPHQWEYFDMAEEAATNE